MKIKMKMTTDIPPEITTPDSVETRLGTLKFFEGLPDKATVEKVYDNLDFMRGVEVFLNTMAAPSTLAEIEGLKSVGCNNSTVVIHEQRVDAKTLLPTPNNTTPYIEANADLQNGPAVVEMPAATAKGVTLHVMAKPAGAACNLRCDYCFFLKKEQLFPGSTFRMNDEVLESYVRQVLAVNDGPEVTVAWQGGEPTLMGLDFFRRAVELEKKYRKPGTRVLNTLQTNGLLLDAEWCRFLRENGFLVGLSLDGPRDLHDAYRHDRRGESVFDRVAAAARRMRSEGVDFNVLCTVNAANGDHPLEVYCFFRDELEAQYLQFIPIVERDNDTGFQEGATVTDRSVRPEQFGRFLNTIFDEWVRHDVGRTFVLNFDWLLGAWVYGQAPVCVFQPICGAALVLEHNGDLYSCDHFVEPACRLGNLLETPLAELAVSAQQRRFGDAKADTLPRMCRQCEFLFACYGECPKNRVCTTSDGEPGLNWLCAGLKAFFAHTRHPMQLMAQLVSQGRPADLVMGLLAEGEKERLQG